MSIEVIAGVVAVAVAIGFGVSDWVQHRQLQDIARKLETDANTRKIVDRFFGFGEGHYKYKCVLPVEHHRRPLPLIPAGDSYALHVLQTLVRVERLDLVRIHAKDNKSAQLHENDDIIFLCAPPTNGALMEIARPIQLNGGAVTKKPKFGEIELPCWFALQEAGHGNTRPVKEIWIQDTSQVRPSEAEQDYVRAWDLPDEVEYVPRTAVQRDLCILMRLTERNRKIIVIAGIHQYGTWVGGHFLERLARGVEMEGKETFVSSKDFVAIISGDFNSNQYVITNWHVERLWSKKPNDVAWSPVPVTSQ